MLITEGEFAVKVMRSDTDLNEERAPVDSLTEFFAILREDRARVLNSSGYVRHDVDGTEQFALRYASLDD